MELPDKMYEDDARERRIRGSVVARIEKLEKEFPKALEELDKLRESYLSLTEIEGFKANVEARRQQMEKQSAIVSSLLKELADLEGFIDRRDARKWRVVQLVVSLGVGTLLGTFLQRFVLGSPAGP